MVKIGGEVPRGMRDLLPEDMIPRRDVLLTIERTFRSYGFEPVETPALEYLKVLRAKCGEEVRNQIYEIEDMGLRFEFTAGLARMASNSSLPKPFKAYQMGPVWRRDEPQKGRYRQFWQADVDIIGSASMKCEAELLACASDSLRAVGITKFTIRLNNRKTLADIIAKLGILDTLSSEDAMRSLDKLKKKGEAEVRKELIGKGAKEKAVDDLFGLIASKPSEEFAGIGELNQIIELSKTYGVGNIRIDLSLARGLGYYTGPIFEIESAADLGSIGGGGRYDDLLGLFGTSSPAVGISFGVDRLMELLRLAKEKKEMKRSTANLFIAVVGDEQYDYAIRTARQLRAEGVNVSLDLTDRSLKKQFEYANSNGIPFMAVVGRKEAAEGKITLRDMSSGKEMLVSVKEALKVLGL